MNCPHCDFALRLHINAAGLKYHALHCDGCGCCFQADGTTPREGVPVCDQAPEVVEERVKTISQMNKSELLEAAAEAGHNVDADDYTVPQLRALLSGVPAADILEQAAAEVAPEQSDVAEAAPEAAPEPPRSSRSRG